MAPGKKYRADKPGKTEAIRAEAALRKSEARLKLALSAAKAGSWEWDLRTNENIWSDELWPLYGLPPHSCTPSSETWLQTIHPDDREPVVKMMRAAVRRGGELNLAWRVNIPGGPERWLMSRGQPEHDGQGRVVRYLGIVIDITDHKRADKALRISEARYRRLHASMTDAFVATDMAGRIQEVNPAFKDMLGYTDAALRKLTYKDLTPAKWHAFEARIVKEQILPKGHSGVYEKEYRRRDGTVLPVELRTFLIRDDAGRPEGMWAIVRDITGRKQAEDFLQQERALYMDLVNTQPAGIYRVRIFNPGTWKREAWLSSKNAPYSFDLVSDRFCKILGIEKKIFERNPGIINDLVHPDDKAGFVKLHTKAMARPVKSAWEGRLLIGGQVRWMRFESIPRPLGNGDVLWTGVLQDITERKQIEETLREKEEQFRLLFNINRDAIFVHEFTAEKMPGKFIEVNEEACRRYGYTRAELLRMRPMELDTPEGLAAIPAAMRQLNAHDHATWEGSHLTRDGRRINVEIINVLFNFDGRSMIMSSVRDITERKRSAETIERQLAEIASYYDNAPIGLAVFDTGLRFLRINRLLAEMNGIPAAGHIGRTVGEILPALEAQAKKVARTIIRTGRPVTDIQFTGETAAQPGVQRIWSEGWFPVRNHENKVVNLMVIVQDITERKRTEEALRASIELFALFMRHSPVYTFIKEVTPTESRVLQASENYRQMIGIPGSAMVGKTMAELFPPEFAAKFTADDWAVVSNGKVLRLDEDLNGRNYTTIKFPIVQGGKTLLAGYTIDITERKQAEDQVRQFSMQLLTVREEERKKVSAALHHDVGSLAVGISAHLDAMEQDIRAGETGAVLKWMRKTRKLFDESVGRLKEVAIELRPPDLDVLGLRAALRQHFSLFTKHRGVRIHFKESLGRRQLPEAVATILFRVAQEALTNAIRHGHARKVDIGLKISKAQIHLVIGDNGQGFDPARQNARVTAHLGLRVMREMVVAAGGAFTVDSGNGKGTVVRVAIPLDAARPTRE
jgi:PAS domain S-box-containing protein